MLYLTGLLHYDHLFDCVRPCSKHGVLLFAWQDVWMKSLIICQTIFDHFPQSVAPGTAGESLWGFNLTLLCRKQIA